MCDDSFELWRRALDEGDGHAFAAARRCHGGLVRLWIARHPQARQISPEEREDLEQETVFRLWRALRRRDSEETTAAGPEGTSPAAPPTGWRPLTERFPRLESFLCFFKACAGSAVIDHVRKSANRVHEQLPAQLPVSVLTEPARQARLDVIWEAIDESVLDEQERMVIVLLYRYGWRPREIVSERAEHFPGGVEEVRKIQARVLRRLSTRLLQPPPHSPTCRGSTPPRQDGARSGNIPNDEK